MRSECPTIYLLRMLHMEYTQMFWEPAWLDTLFMLVAWINEISIIEILLEISSIIDISISESFNLQLFVMFKKDFFSSYYYRTIGANQSRFWFLNISIARFMFFFHLKDNRVGLVSVKQKFKESREGSGYPRFVWAASFNSLYISRCLFLSIGKRDIDWHCSARL